MVQCLLAVQTGNEKVAAYPTLTMLSLEWKRTKINQGCKS